MNQPHDLPTFPSSHEDRTDIYIATAPNACIVPGHGHHLVTVPLEGLRTYNRHANTPGHYIQDLDALGCLDPGKRELLMTGYCDEVFAHLAEDEDDDRVPCPDGCGPQEVTADHSNPGFTGAGITILDLACGHQYVDLSADTLDNC